MILWSPGAGTITINYVREKRQQPFVGQEQEYFLCRLHADAPESSLGYWDFTSIGGEF